MGLPLEGVLQEPCLGVMAQNACEVTVLHANRVVVDPTVGSRQFTLLRIFVAAPTYVECGLKDD
jgi:hypothetical protein